MSSLVRQMLKPGVFNLHQNRLIFNQIQPTFTPGSLFSALPLRGSTPVGLISLHTSAVLERARQSTRLRKRKVMLDNKKKKDERLRKNPPPMPEKIKLMLKAKGFGSKPMDWRKADTKPFPVDNVWDERYHSWRRLPVSEALDCLREHYDPTMLNNPDGIVFARVEFNLSAVKKDKYMDAFSKMVPLYHPFERGVEEKTIMVFSKNEESLKLARDAGAERAGGIDLIEDIAKGKIEVIDYDFFIAHDDIAMELKPLLGILREKFPKKLLGTVGTDMEKMVKTFANGQMVEVKKPKSTLGYNDDPTFGYCEAMIGRLGMPVAEIQVNFTTLLENLRENAPKKSGEFITRAEFYVDEHLKCKFSVFHDLVDDRRFKELQS